MLLDQWLDHIGSVHFRSIDLQLERVTTVLARVLPQGPAYRVISVAGTNGKGSSVAMLDSILRQAGLDVGTYTSPHLVSYRERIRVAGEMASEDELCGAFAQIEDCRREVPLTYFEFGTLAALLIFEHRGVDIAVMEVGMGGRLDAVNAVDSLATLITSISVDHQHWLGRDRETIAVEKAGIFRRGCPAVCADPEPPLAIADQADRAGARLYQIDRHFSYEMSDDKWIWRGPSGELPDLPRPPLAGDYQIQNASGVIMLLLSLRDELTVSDQHVRSGLSLVHIRGRFELLQENPRVVVDVAHNEAAISEVLTNLYGLGVTGRTLVVCGMLQDKPIDQLGARFSKVADRWYVGEIDDVRACPAEQLASVIRKHTEVPVRSYPSVVNAFEAACDDANAEDIVLSLGSFHTVGDIICALDANHLSH